MARFFYDNMALVRCVEDAKHAVRGRMGLPRGTDVTGAMHPNIERHIIGDLRADLDDVLKQDVADRYTDGEQ